MNFRTILDLPISETKIDHRNKILMMGSCFANNIGQKLIDAKFDVCLNPFGTIYNPFSITNSLNILLSGKKFSEADIFQTGETYNSFLFHSSFASLHQDEYLDRINRNVEFATNQLHNADLLLITFGTSYVYENKENKQIVSNCHKLPPSHFNRYRLSIPEIVSAWSDILNELKIVNPKIKIIFTVSPIRHMRDGAHDNQLSKASLLLAIEELNRLFPQTSYFPAYEIVLDDLRDYRFYDTDMCHPNNLAINYIWEKFENMYFDDQTKTILKRWTKIRQDLLHKPFNPQGKEYISFLKQTLLKLRNFQSEFPFVSVTSETEMIEKKINSLLF